MTLDYKKIAKLKVSEVMKDLPVKLKNPKCFEPIEKRVRRAMFSDHAHRTVKSFVGCKRCQEKLNRRREIIKEEGFKSLEQYFGWRRIMDIIVNEKEIKISSKFVKQ